MRQGLSSCNLVCGGGFETQTAGGTQTQAGATALTKGNVLGTVAVANDGFALPRADFPSQVGQEVVIQNVSTNAGKVWPFYNTDTSTGSGGTINAGSANASVTLAASSTLKFICTAKDTWKSIQLS